MVVIRESGSIALLISLCSHHEKLISEWLEKLLRSIDYEMAIMCKDEEQIELNFSLSLSLFVSCLRERVKWEVFDEMVNSKQRMYSRFAGISLSIGFNFTLKCSWLTSINRTTATTTELSNDLIAIIIIIKRGVRLNLYFMQDL